MTRDELADKLHRLDPGASLIVGEDVLARIFNVVTLSQASHEALKSISDFALEHDCTFSLYPQTGGAPCFHKNDIL
jgi:hypothetical protein